MAKHIFVTSGSTASRIRIEFQPLPACEEYPAGYAWGALYLWLGETLVWSEQVDGTTGPVRWTWVDFLEGLGRVWPWLVQEQTYPIPIHPQHPGMLDEALSRRWKTMERVQRDDEEDLIFDFNHRHNLALLVRGINLPRVLVLRQASEMLIWSPLDERAVHIELSECLNVFQAFGDCIYTLLGGSTTAPALLARKRWEERSRKSLEHKPEERVDIDRRQGHASH